MPETQPRQIWREIKAGLQRLWALPMGWRLAATAVLVVIALVTIPSALTGGGDEDLPPSGDRPAQADPTQAIYNALLRQARRDVRDDPVLNCEPDYQQLVIDQVRGATGAEKVLIQFAMGDACIEAGQWGTSVARYSPYHAKAE